ncbi:hypothetical protein VQL36_18570 [Chengkuizengella sp. SCS-71B]|uniref:hypothetical protein n=1 Tax=Chengkuizengella sp. SCS-71B TaxID=3115290 RepID=UPI0032C21405
MQIITTYKDLDNWLNDNFGFEDGYVSDLQKIDESTVRMRVGFQIEGNYVAGTPKRCKRFS